jgi:hypothetical protein
MKQCVTNLVLGKNLMDWGEKIYAALFLKKWIQENTKCSQNFNADVDVKFQAFEHKIVSGESTGLILWRLN